MQTEVAPAKVRLSEELGQLPERAEWGAPEVQAIYELLCSDDAPPPPELHWEGWIAGRIVAEVLLLSVAAERERCARLCEGMGFGATPADYAWTIRTDWASDDESATYDPGVT